jgi:hypothetical protein
VLRRAPEEKQNEKDAVSGFLHGGFVDGRVPDGNHIVDPARARRA